MFVKLLNLFVFLALSFASMAGTSLFPQLQYELHDVDCKSGTATFLIKSATDNWQPYQNAFLKKADLEVIVTGDRQGVKKQSQADYKLEWITDHSMSSSGSHWNTVGRLKIALPENIRDCDELKTLARRTISSRTDARNHGKGPVKLIAQEVAGFSGDTIELPVAVEDFIDISYLQHSMHFNPYVFQVDAVGSFNLPGLGIFIVNNSSGTMAFFWFGPFSGVHLTDGSEIYALDIVLTGEGGDFSSVDLNGFPVALAAFSQFQFVNIIPVNGSVEILENLVDISGTINDQFGVPITNVTIALSGDVTDTLVTGTDGLYSFTDLPAGGDYTVTPSRTDNLTNGVDGVDAVLLLRHILGIEVITDPLKLIALDVDEDCDNDTTDLRLISNVITHLTGNTTFPTGKSWRFSPAELVFPDGIVPCEFPESLSFTALSEDAEDQDFTGIKLADVDATADPQSFSALPPSLASRSTTSNLLDIPNQELALSVFPNPAIDQVTFSFELSRSGIVRVDIVTIMGRTVATFENEFDAGSNRFNWNVQGNLEPGTYLVHMQSGGLSAIQKFVVINN